MDENAKKFPAGFLTVRIESSSLTKRAYITEQYPYVVLSLKEITFQTDIKKGFEPEWNQAFTFDLAPYGFKDQLLIRVVNHNRFFRDEEIGQLAISLEEFITKKNVKSKSYSFYSHSSQDPAGTLLITFSFREESSLSISPSIKPKKGLTASELGFNGLIKLTILSGINLLSNGMKLGYLSVTTASERRTTRTFNTPITQFQSSFLFKTSNSETPWLFELHNRPKPKASERTVGSLELDLTKLFLVVNRPVSYGLELNGSCKAKILAELRFLENGFVRRPEGTVRIEFMELPSAKKDGFYRMFYNGESVTVNPTKPGTTHEVRVIRAKNVFEAFNLEYFESAAISDKLLGGMMPLKPKGVYRVNFCELGWKPNEKDKEEFESIVEGKIQSPKINKPLNFTLMLTFRYSLPVEKKPIQRGTGQMDKTTVERTLIEEPTTEIEDPNVSNSIVRKPKGHNLTIFKRPNEPLRLVLELTNLHLRSFPLLSLESLELQGGVYLKVTNPETTLSFFTAMTSNLSKLYWNVQFPLSIYSNSKKVTFSLCGAIFGDFDAENGGFEPWELFSFEFNLNDLEDNIFNASQQKTLASCVLSSQMVTFLKRSKDAKQIEYFKDIVLDVCYKLHASSFISQPEGLLRVSQVQLSDFRFLKTKDSCYSYLRNPHMTVFLGSQAQRLSEVSLKGGQQVFSGTVAFLTGSCKDRLLLVLTDEQKHDGSAARVLCTIEVELFNHRFEENECYRHVVELETVSRELRGRLQMSLQYNTQKRGLLSVFGSIPAEGSDLSGSKALNVARIQGLQRKSPVSQADVARILIKPANIVFLETKPHEFYSLELWFGGRETSEPRKRAIFLNCQGALSNELSQELEFIDRRPFNSLFCQITMYFHTAGMDTISEIYLAEFPWSRSMLESPGWNLVRLQFLSNSSPNRQIDSFIDLMLRVQLFPCEDYLLRLHLGQIRALVSNQPVKKLWNSSNLYFLRVFSDDLSVDRLYSAVFKPVEALKRMVLTVETDCGSGFLCQAVDSLVLATDCRLKTLKIPSFEQQVFEGSFNVAEKLNFWLFNREKTIEGNGAFDWRGDEKVNLELQGSVSIGELVSQLSYGEENGFAVSMRREGLKQAKKPLLGEEDEEEWSESVDVSLLEVVVLGLNVEIRNGLLRRRTGDSAGEKRRENESERGKEKGVMVLNMNSFNNICSPNASLIGLFLSFKKKPRLAELLSLSLISQSNKQSPQKLNETRLCLQRFSCPFNEPLLLPFDPTTRKLLFRVFTCLYTGSLAGGLNQAALDFEEATTHVIRLGDMRTGEQLQVVSPVYKEEGLLGVFNAEMGFENGEFLNSPEGSLEISAAEIIDFVCENNQENREIKGETEAKQENSKEKDVDIERNPKNKDSLEKTTPELAENKHDFSNISALFLEKTKDLVLEFRILSFKDLKFKQKALEAPEQEEDHPEMLDFSAFVPEKTTNSFVYFKGLFLSTSQISDCLIIRVLQSQKNPKTSRFCFRNRVIRLGSLRKTKENNIFEAILPFEAENEGKFICFRLKLSFKMLGIEENREVLSLTGLSRLMKFKQKAKAIHHRLHRVSYWDPLARKLVDFGDDFLGTFEGFSQEELKKEYRDMNDFLDKINEKKPNSNENRPNSNENKPNFNENKSNSNENQANPSKSQFFRVLKHTSFQLKSSFKAKTGLIITCKAIFPNQPLEEVKITVESGFLALQELRSEDDDHILQTTVTLERDFFLVFTSPNPSEYLFSLEYSTKKAEKMTETAVFQSFPQEKARKVLLDFKPGGFRVFISHESLENREKTGKIAISMHRLVYLEPENRKTGYFNRNLFDPEGKNQENGLDFQLQVGLELENQRFRSCNFDKKGLFEEIIEKQEFFYSNSGSLIKILLFLAKKKEATQLKKAEIQLAEAEIPINLLFNAKKTAKKAFFAVELQKRGVFEGKKDILGEFLGSFNSSGIFLLVGVENWPMEWSQLRLGLKTLEIAKEMPGVRYLGVNIRVLQLQGEVMSSIKEFESELLEITRENSQESQEAAEKTKEDNKKNDETSEKTMKNSQKLLETDQKTSKNDTKSIQTVEKTRETIEKNFLTFGFSPANRLPILLTEFTAPSLIALASLISSSPSSPIASRYLPLKYFNDPRFLAVPQDFRLDFPDQPDFRVLLTVSRSLRQDFEAENGEENKGNRPKDQEKLDFRKNRVLELLSSLMNTNSPEILQLVLQEVNEYLLFSASIDCVEMLFNMMTMLLCIYHQNPEVSLLCFQNLAGLIATEPKETIKYCVLNSFSELLLEFLAQSLKKQEQKAEFLMKKLTENSRRSFELVGIKPETLERMGKGEIETRLYDNFLVRKSSFFDDKLSFKRNNSKNTDLPAEFAKIMKYILRIMDFLMDFGQEITKILDFMVNFTDFFALNIDLAWLLLNIGEKYLISPQNLAAVKPEFIRFLLELTCTVLKNPQLSAKEEDQYLRKLEKVYSFGNMRSKAEFWTVNETNKVVFSLIEAIKVNNAGNSQDYLTNELGLLEKTLTTLEKTTDNCLLLKKSGLLGVLTSIFFGEYLEKRGLVGFLISDRLFANGIAIVLLLYKSFSARDWDEMVGFLEALRKMQKEREVGFGEVRKKTLKTFWKEVYDKRTMEEMRLNNEAMDRKKASGNNTNLAKKYLVSRLDWMK